jgi:hypothetical protein
VSGQDETCPLCGADLNPLTNTRSRPNVCLDAVACMDRRAPAPKVLEVHDCLTLGCRQPHAGGSLVDEMLADPPGGEG